MKRAVVLMLIFALCVSLCACGSREGLASPGTEPGEKPQNSVPSDSGTANTADDGGSADGSDGAPGGETGDTGLPEGETGENGENDDGSFNGSGPADNGGGNKSNQGNSGGGSGGAGQKNTIRDTVDTTEKAPENDSTYTFSENGRNITVSYGPGMSPSEAEGVLCIEYGSQRFYVDDVTDSYNNSRDKSSFLYEYAYNNAIQWVNRSFGSVTAFDGEVVMKGSGNVISGYEGTMTCEYCETVLAYVKLIQLDGGGYAVATGICDGNNATVFDNIQVH